jgi:hypothetical protein
MSQHVFSTRAPSTFRGRWNSECALRGDWPGVTPCVGLVYYNKVNAQHIERGKGALRLHRVAFLQGDFERRRKPRLSFVSSSRVASD